MLTQLFHQFCQLVIIMKSRRAAAEVKLLDFTIVIKQFSLHFDFRMQQPQVTISLLFMPGDFLGTSTVVAKRAAERQMDIKRQWFGNQLIVTGGRESPIGRGIKTLDELNGRRVGGIPWRRHVVALDQIRIECNLLFHHLSLGRGNLQVKPKRSRSGRY